MNYNIASLIFTLSKKLLLTFFGHPLAEASYEFCSVHSSVHPFARQDLGYGSSVVLMISCMILYTYKVEKVKKSNFLNKVPSG